MVFSSMFYYLVFIYRISFTTCNVRSSCKLMSGLSREQLDICYKANDVTMAALEGLDLAVRECQFQVFMCVFV